MTLTWPALAGNLLRPARRVRGFVIWCVPAANEPSFGSRDFEHCHPTAEWTPQRFRTYLTGGERYRCVIRDRDAIYAGEVDRALKSMHLGVLTTPVRAPQANAYCDCLIGTIGRECLDFMIPPNARHLQRILAERVPHYNPGRPYVSLGPGIPDRPSSVAPPSTGHRLPHGHRVAAAPILGGLHHEYRLEAAA